MNVTDDDYEDLHAALAQAVGVELRQARESRGWTRPELVARLPSGIAIQTVGTYETGTRPCTVGRFVEICMAIGVSAPDLLRWAMQQEEIDLPTIGMAVDLYQIVTEKQRDLLPLRRWALARLADNPVSGIAHLEWPAVHELATQVNIPQHDFIHILLAFTPRPRLVGR